MCDLFDQGIGSYYGSLWTHVCLWGLRGDGCGRFMPIVQEGSHHDHEGVQVRGGGGGGGILLQKNKLYINNSKTRSTIDFILWNLDKDSIFNILSLF